MLTKPASCSGCVLQSVGTGFMESQHGSNGVLLLGEALGKDEVESGKPFVGAAGGRLSRLIQWAGFDRADFSISNAVWCRPPDNKLEGTAFESAAVQHCRSVHWNRLLASHKVVVPLGNVPTGALLGRKGILSLRGYVEEREGFYVLPTVHPSFIQRGQSKWSAAFIQDIQKAVRLAQLGVIPPQLVSYVLDPTPAGAIKWVEEFEAAVRSGDARYLAFDIETPGKPDDEDDADTDADAPDQTWNILRIGFSYAGYSALSIPWEPPFFQAIRRLLESACDKIVWNAGFDVPRVRRAGFSVNGTIHDGMVAWHILHSDLPKSLKFATTFCCPWQPAWKHLSAAKPAFYNATDADVEWRCWESIEAELRRTGLWEVYQRDVLDLQPVLEYMQAAGLRVDVQVRADRARRLDARLRELHDQLEGLIPESCRRIEHIYQTAPKSTDGLLSRPGVRTVPICSGCGLRRPGKSHFKRFVRKSNPCADAKAVPTQVDVVEYYRLAEFKLSRNLLIAYHKLLNRPLPTVWDKAAGARKVSFDEEQMKKLILLYPTDPVYGIILEYRKLDKLASTYIGRPVAD